MDHLDKLLQQQVAHAYRNAPAVRQIMDAAGITPRDIQTRYDLEKIPVISKDRLQEMQEQNPPFGGFLAVPPRDLKRIYVSPGPIYDPHGFSDAEAFNAAAETFREASFNSLDLVINTFMYHMVPAGMLMDEALGELGATVIPMGPGNTDFQIKVMLDLGVTAYVGTPSFLEMIYDKAAQMGISQLPLKKAFFTAEPYFASQRQLFEENYGLVTAQAYATADIGFIAYERPGHSGMYVSPHLLVQICDPETGAILEDGQPGEVVVTTFNRAYPLIRFGTGDLSIMYTEEERQKLTGLIGRSGEAIKVRGMFLHPNAIRKAMSEFSNIQTIQAVIGREGARDTVQLQVVLSEGDLDTDALRQAVKEFARLSIDSAIIVDQVEGSRTIRDTRVYP